MAKIKHLEGKYSNARYELIIACDPLELKFYLWLKLWAINKHSAFPSYITICKELNITKPTLSKLLKEMEAANRLKIERSLGRNSIYDITWYDEVNNRTSKETLPVEDTDQLRNFTATSKETLPLTSKETLPKRLESITTRNKPLSKDKTTASYGDEKINSCMDFIKKKLNGNPDGTIKDNRRYCHLLINRFLKDYPDKDPTLLIKALIERGIKDEFIGSNITNFKYLFYNSQKIILRIKSQRTGIIA